MPLVHTAVERHASVYGASVASSELVIEPAAEGSAGTGLSQLLLASVPIASEHGCDAILLPIRPASAAPDGSLPVDEIAREVDRAELVSRLAALDTGRPCSIVTPVVDLTERQVLDLAGDMGVPDEMCWWHGVSGDDAATRFAAAWRRPPGVAAASSDSLGSARLG